MNVSGRWIALGLAGSSVVCVALATTVSATPPAGGVVEEPPDSELCSPYSLEYARTRLAEAARAKLAVEELGPSSETEWRLMDQKEHTRTLRECRVSTKVDLCYGYRPPSAYYLESRYGDDASWNARVVFAGFEASLCAKK